MIPWIICKCSLSPGSIAGGLYSNTCRVLKLNLVQSMECMLPDSLEPLDSRSSTTNVKRDNARGEKSSPLPLLNNAWFHPPKLEIGKRDNALQNRQHDFFRLCGSSFGHLTTVQLLVPGIFSDRVCLRRAPGLLRPALQVLESTGLGRLRPAIFCAARQCRCLPH